MITKVRKTYQCEHCRKIYVMAAAAEKHEKYCKNNPANRHKCFEFCLHLEKQDVYETCYGHNGYEHETHVGVSFLCKKTRKYMWSFIAERRGLLEINPELGEIRMPLSCEFYKEPC